MNCSTCGAWSEVLSTRKSDGGHRVDRRHRCANEHVFSSVQVHRPVYCSAKPRQLQYLGTVAARIDRWARNQMIRRRVAAGEQKTTIARDMGLTKSAIGFIAK